jgi:hypothetical protein
LKICPIQLFPLECHRLRVSPISCRPFFEYYN